MSLHSEKLADILRYLHDKMDLVEKTAFENEMQTNSDLKQQVEFDAALLQVLKKDKHEKFKAFLETQIVDAPKTQAKTIPLWQNNAWRVVAAIAAVLLIVFAFALWQKPSEPNTPAFTGKDTNTTHSNIVETPQKPIDTLEKNPIHISPPAPKNLPDNTPKVVTRQEKKKHTPSSPQMPNNAPNYLQRSNYLVPFENPPVSDDDAKEIVEKSDSLMGQKKYQEALYLLNSSSEKEKNSDMWMLLGQCYFYLGDFENANYYLKKSLKIGMRDAALARWYKTLIHRAKKEKELASLHLDTFFMVKKHLLIRDSVYINNAYKLKQELTK